MACSGGSSPDPGCCPVKVTPSAPLVHSRAAILTRLAEEYRAAVVQALAERGLDVPVTGSHVIRGDKPGRVIIFDIRTPARSILPAMGRALDASFHDRFRAHSISWIGVRDPSGDRTYVAVGLLHRFHTGAIGRSDLLAGVA